MRDSIDVLHLLNLDAIMLEQEYKFIRMLDTEDPLELAASTVDESAELLAARIYQGDSTAETELINYFQRGLRLLILAKTYDASLTDDIVQEAFMICIEKIRQGKLRENDKTKPYLFAIAMNVLRDHRRKQQRFTDWNEEDDARTEEHLGESQMFEAERLRVIKRYIQELPTQRDREILEDFYLNEVSKENLCRSLEIDSVHFSRVLFRAKQRLKVVLAKAGYMNSNLSL